MSERSLARVQELFYRLVTSPEGVARALEERPEDAAALAETIHGDDALPAVERLDIYANMYFFRLFEVLTTDFPKVAAVMREAGFHNLITDYLLAHPPTRPSVRDAGLHLAAFIRTHAAARDRPWLGDLAALERARLEVFDAADSAPLDGDALGRIAPSEYAGLRLGLVRAHLVLALDDDAPRVWKAIEEGRDDWQGGLGDPPERRRSWIVWRGHERMVVHQRPLEERELALMPALASGLSFARICEVLGAGLDDQQAVVAAARWLGRGVAAGLLVRLGS